MLRKLYALIAAALCAILLTAPLRAASPTFCDPLKSTLCQTVGLVLDFEEASDAPRADSISGAFVAFEPDGYDVGRRTGKLGSYAADFAGSENSCLRVPGLPNVGPGFWTLTAWVYPDTAGSNGQSQTILANDYKSQPGTHVYLFNSSGSLQLRVDITSRETNTVTTVTAGSNLTVAAWNFITVGVSAWPSTYGQANMFAQVNNGARGNAALPYAPRGSNSDTYIGARKSQPTGQQTPFDGGLDQLLMFGTVLNAAQVTKMYGSGSGNVYPFVD